MAHDTTTWGLCSGHSWSWCGFLHAQYRQFCLFTEPLRENIASSLMMRNLPRSACVCTICWQQWTRNALCAAVNSWKICSLYVWKCKSWCKIRRTLLSNKFKSWECRCTDRRGLLSKAILTRWIISGDWTVFRWVQALNCMDPVSPLTHPLTDYFSWRCSPTLPIITKFQTKLSLHGYDRLA
jgi:hypothetical protein